MATTMYACDYCLYGKSATPIRCDHCADMYCSEACAHNMATKKGEGWICRICRPSTSDADFAKGVEDAMRAYPGAAPDMSPEELADNVLRQIFSRRD